ncbi:MAG: hypothetical protein HDR15_10345 [Lachnospiraceae bacterium]|nr:hypothetical protein [Lachnospiraceae bacterium]
MLVGVIADEEANLYRPADIINLDLEDTKEDALVLWIFRGEDAVSSLLPAVQ